MRSEEESWIEVGIASEGLVVLVMIDPRHGECFPHFIYYNFDRALSVIAILPSFQSVPASSLRKREIAKQRVSAPGDSA
jgi:hypothetical protein